MIQLDPAVMLGRGGRPVCEHLDEASLTEHILEYVDPCCVEEQAKFLAWLKEAKPGAWYDAAHYDDEIYVCCAE
jgi:hypothetical protein